MCKRGGGSRRPSLLCVKRTCAEQVLALLQDHRVDLVLRRNVRPDPGTAQPAPPQLARLLLVEGHLVVALESDV